MKQFSTAPTTACTGDGTGMCMTGIAGTARVLFMLALLTMFCTGAQAGGTRQLITGGASTVEGAAGGGIVPWAVLAGYATREEFANTVFYSRADTGDYRLDAFGAAMNFNNRLEISVARQEFDLITLGPALGLPGAKLKQDVVGLKYRVLGDIIYTKAPQVSVGVQYKKNRDSTVPQAVGAKDDDSVDFYASAAKLFLGGAAGYNFFVNGTVRYTEGNETGLLGYGGPGGDYKLNLEGAAGVLLSRKFVVGAEYRQKSSRLEGLPEDDWYDFFLGYFPNRHIGVVAGYVNLGEVATLRDQDGWYLSIQGSF